MENSLLQRILVKIGIALLIIAFIDLVYINYWVLKQSNLNSASQEQKEPIAQLEEKRTVETLESPPAAPQASPKENIGPSPIVKTETVVEKQTQTIVQTAQKEIFIPIGSGSTFKSDYEDLAGLEVTIDSAKYSLIESAVFEASIWVQDGNGKMFAQLYNTTDKHPVWFSEIAASSSKSTLVTSPKITLDNGSRTYKVQAKTNLTSYAAHVENARIKIVLK